MGRLKASVTRKFALHRLLPLRQRYIMTSNNTLRLRYVAGLMVAFAGIGTLAAAQMTDSFGPIRLNEIAEISHIQPHVMMAATLPVQTTQEVAMAVEQKPMGPQNHIVKVSTGETMAGVLEKAGVDGDAAYQVVKAMSEHFDPRKVRAGQEVALKFDPAGDDYALSEMKVRIDPVTEVVVSRDNDENFIGRVHEKEVKEHTYAKMARIETSLYGSAARAGIPASVIGELIKIYSQNIDFQRDIQPDDKIEVLYSAYETEDGKFVRNGDLQYASLTVGSRVLPIYRFQDSDGRVDYFNDKGLSIRNTLMKTPVDGARISSGFGMRFHPVLGYTKMHKGIDFAVAAGTPIFAAGDGTIEREERSSSYGNYIRIRHNSSLKTAYAHMQRFASGTHIGERVHQGEIIGYVGQTGRATGPHLHYEVLVNDQQVNPKSVDLPTGEQLTGKDLKRFKDIIRTMQKQYVAMVDGVSFAFLHSDNSAVR